MRRSTWAVPALTAIAVLGSCTAQPDFPTGRWMHSRAAGGVAVTDFRPDGRAITTAGSGLADQAQIDAARYEVAGTTLILAESSSCTYQGHGDPARYTWSMVDGALHLDVVADDCRDRRERLDGADLTEADAEVEQVRADPVAAPAPWWNDQVFYEVFVRSFADSDGDGIGDLRGLIGRLDDLNDGDPGTTEDLGVTALWLMPITESPSYHGYDTTDYVTVESDYGTGADFRELMAAAHERGMRVIIDLVLNHTSDQHPWFTAAATDASAPTRDWYLWSAADPGWTTPWGTRAWHPSGQEYYLGLFWEGMPDLDYRNPAVTAQMAEVARYWLADMGADGFRLDAVRHLIEQDGQVSGTPATHAWLRSWDDSLDAVDPQALTVGEVWDATDVVAPYVVDDEVDLAFEFSLADGILSAAKFGRARDFDRALAGVLQGYPAGQFAPFLTNHDQNRTMSVLGGDVAKAKLAASALLTLPGVPFLYYGEEIGMTGQKPDERIRTPMQWDGTAGAGFTAGTPWTEINGDAGTVNVDAQRGDPQSLLSRYRTLIRARTEHPALTVGGLTPISVGCEQATGYLRATQDGSDAVVVVLHFGADEATGCPVSGEVPLAPGTYRAADMLAGRSLPDLQVGRDGAVAGLRLDLAPHQALVLALRPAQ
jgi:glycosidase